MSHPVVARGHRYSLRCASLLVGAILALTGCSSDAPAPAATATWPRDSPLAKAMGGSLDRPDQSALAKDRAAIEDLTAACMTEQGFDYIPVDHALVYGTIDEELLEGQGTPEWAAQHGYGIVMMEVQADGEPVPDPVDPNTSYVESLSTAESIAYSEALYGTPRDPTQAELDAGEMFADPGAGCSGAAQQQVSGEETELFNGPDHADFLEAMYGVQAKAMEDPRLTEADRAWSDCMADAGYTDMPTPTAAFDSVSARMSALRAAGRTRANLAELRELELDTATADSACKDRVDWQTTWTTAVFDAETTFVEDHKAEIAEFVAAYHGATR